jgi:hypothetical protein
MQPSNRVPTYCLLSALILASFPVPLFAQTNSDAALSQAQKPAAERDGQHDFDPLIGSWKYHLRRRLHPLTGSTTWVDLDGTGICYKLWDGASLDTIEVDGPTGHIEGLTLRLYNPQSHQWSLSWANSKNGIIDPAQVGEFKNGRGEFYAQDTFNGKTILIRFVWSGMTTNSPHFEQSFSDDGGKTWEVNWITDQTHVDEDFVKMQPSQRSTQTNPDGSKLEAQETSAERDGQHDFDFLTGPWKVHLKVMSNPLADSPKWVESDGITTTRTIWDGRANYSESESDGPTGHKESMTLRLYNPLTHQWNLYWASSKAGVLGLPPNTGEFKNGRGEFFDGELFHGKGIFVRDVWSSITPNSALFEQSFSNDGGKTWEANWIAAFTRAGS